jgi:hypothetical protein
MYRHAVTAIKKYTCSPQKKGVLLVFCVLSVWYVVEVPSVLKI